MNGISTNKKTKSNLELSSPWEIYRRKLAALFTNDNEIDVCEVYETESKWGSEYNVDIRVYKHRKYEALSQLLPDRVKFGNVELRIYVYDLENVTDEKPDYERIFSDLFEGNDVFDSILKTVDYTGGEHLFAAFKPAALQFFADDISDPYGNQTWLAQDVARDILGAAVEGKVGFCTSLISIGE